MFVRIDIDVLIGIGVGFGVCVCIGIIFGVVWVYICIGFVIRIRAHAVNIQYSAEYYCTVQYGPVLYLHYEDSPHYVLSF